VYFHGGVNFEPYREQYKKYCRKDFKYYEIYNASEGFAIQDLNYSSDLLLMLDYGISMSSFRWILLGHGTKAIRLADVVFTNYALVIYN
jgi:hypothetical protein